jgi:phosphoribosyl-ATP pyrophosphohydrolase/phosphoribosyl-AMP cyclohydrolase
MNLEELKFDKDGLIPAIIQDAESGEVLMQAYMNREALEKSLETGRTHFWSRSRQKLWMKGETSGHIQTIVEKYFDCDSDALLFKVKQTEAACHTGHFSCFFNQISENCDIIEKGEKVFDPAEVYQAADVYQTAVVDRNDASILKELYGIVVDRRDHPKEGSYTNYLFTKGLDKILKKVGEESAEVIIASKNRSKEEVTYEVSDLIYHLMVLLVEQGVTLEDIYAELRKRR